MSTLNHTLQLLSRTPPTLRALLHDIPAELATANYGNNTFSPRDVLAHLIHGEQVDWIPRLDQILEGRGNTPFEPYVIEEARAVGKGKALNQLLDEFARLRAINLDHLRALELTPTHLAMTGIHPDPAFGPVTVANLIAAWAAHDLHHVAQICKALAFQLADDVGPWAQYMGIITQARNASAQ